MAGTGRGIRILIVGAGATGLALGVRLSAAGRDVTYLVRAGRRDALVRDGAVLTAPDGVHTEPAKALTTDELTEPFDLVIIAVKATAIDAIVDDIAAAVGPTTVIVPILNGMRHVDVLGGRYPDRLVGGAMKIVATLDEHGGAVQMTSLAEVTVGSFSDAPLPAEIVDTLDVPGYALVEAPDIAHRLWEKWAFIAAAGVITCLFDNSVGNIRAAGGLPYIEQAILETEAVAAAAGYPSREPAHAQSIAILCEPGSAFTSSLYRDLAAGKASEAEHILGDLADRARAAGVETPLLDMTLIRIRAADLP